MRTSFVRGQVSDSALPGENRDNFVLLCSRLNRASLPCTVWRTRNPHEIAPAIVSPAAGAAISFLVIFTAVETALGLLPVSRLPVFEFFGVHISFVSHETHLPIKLLRNFM
jgi:hypothetical protein